MSIVDFRKYARDYYHAKIKTKPPILPANIEHKVCENCKQDKPIKNFHPRVTRKDGYQAWCKDCLRNSLRKSRKERIERAKETGTLEEYNRDRAKKRREACLKNQYGFTVEQYDALLLRQTGRCAICKGNNPGKSNKGVVRAFWNIDHNHATGKVRGLLCSNCNTAIGLFKEDKTTIINAAEYLERSEV